MLIRTFELEAAVCISRFWRLDLYSISSILRIWALEVHIADFNSDYVIETFDQTSCIFWTRLAYIHMYKRQFLWG